MVEAWCRSGRFWRSEPCSAREEKAVEQGACNEGAVGAGEGRWRPRGYLGRERSALDELGVRFDQQNEPDSME